tara:strand:- start:688 stop:1383 length:696 start_codon:yes stop_codon:yes gene_type:complete
LRTLFFFVLILTVIKAQEYRISIFGVDVCIVHQNLKMEEGNITFSTENIGITSILWPAKNFYNSEYDSSTFNLIKWSKNISQGTFKQKTSGNFIDSIGTIEYNKKMIPVLDNTKNIFSLLAMVQTKEHSYLDTKWFNFEHEGSTGKARFVWSDSVTIEHNNKKEICDHYRLDVAIDTEYKLYEKSDYFLGEILSPGMVKQLWVSRKNPKKIIKATFKTMGIPLKAIIYEQN